MTRTPAVTLISPGIIKWNDVDFGVPHLVALGSYLREKLGVRVEILDLSYEGGDHASLQKALEELGPHLAIGLSCYSSFDYLRVMSLAGALKRAWPDVPLIAGGYHASALPTDVVFEGSPFDAVVVGEGERPMAKLIETLLGGGRIDTPIVGPDNVADLDTLPPYDWSLLDRYWPRAHQLGRKMQIYFSRGCPYHCTFCMERAKTEYKWRAMAPERALDELARLSKKTDLSRWVINIADPLFGFQRRWRRTVLAGIAERKLLPRQFWTLTRTDDVDEEDVELYARARFSIGIGAESGSPTMLGIMQKTRDPEAYLGALERLAETSRRHGLPWATNVIVGHPGETRETMRETHAFVRKLFLSAPDTRGWLSIDPFRLYPGALVHEQMGEWSQRFGTRFHHPQWWKRWYDASFLAEHNDPSASLDYAGRVTEMYALYGPLVGEIQQRFRGTGRDVDRVLERSLAEQKAMLSPEMRDRLLARAERARAASEGPAAGPTGLRGRLVVLGATSAASPPGASPAVPIAIDVRDPDARLREGWVRRLLDRGAVRTERLIEAILAVPLREHFDAAAIEAFLAGRDDRPGKPGAAPRWLGSSTSLLLLEALEAGVGDRVLARATSSWVQAILRALVGPEGELRADGRDPTVGAAGRYDRVLIGGALPAVPPWMAGALEVGGRFVGFVGPRFRPQDLVVVSPLGDALIERRVARVAVPVLAGRHGWLAS